MHYTSSVGDNLMLLYYITDRLQFGGNECARRQRLLAAIGAAAQAGIDYIQLRERDLNSRNLEQLAREAVRAVREANRSSSRLSDSPGTRLIINSRTDIALAVEADGVHLRSGDLVPSEARAIWGRCVKAGVQDGNRSFLVAASCHTVAETRLAEAHGADFAVFAPVFEKVAAPQRSGVGLSQLREACQGLMAPPNVEGVGAGRMPVLALGGVTLENAMACLEAGAAGIAAIRLFQDHDISETVMRLRQLGRQGG